MSRGTGQEFTSTGAISFVDTQGGGGSDHVTYELDGNLQPGISEEIAAGSSSKSVSGSLQLTVNIVGKVLDHSSLLVFGTPNPKSKLTMSINDSGEVDGNFTAGITSLNMTKPGHGPEVLNFQSSGTIGSSGEIDSGIVGSKANDVNVHIGLIRSYAVQSSHWDLSEKFMGKPLTER